jgi:prenyltransferase beta subunit
LSGAFAAAIVACLLASGCVQGTDTKTRDRAVEYLTSHQNPDGGFSATMGQPSEFSTSAWAALALAAAHAPKDRLDAVASFLASRSANVTRNDTGSFSATNARSLYVLAALALHGPDTSWGGVDLLPALEAQASNASLALNEKIILLGTLGRAHRANGHPALRDEILGHFVDEDQSEIAKDAWFRAYAILALVASGSSPEEPTTKQWARSLLHFQKEDGGGFRTNASYEPDASTTAGVLVVFTKVPFVYSEQRRAAQAFLAEVQQSDGSVRFSHKYDFSPSKTTAEAVLGLSGNGLFGV